MSGFVIVLTISMFLFMFGVRSAKQHDTAIEASVEAVVAEREGVAPEMVSASHFAGTTRVVVHSTDGSFCVFFTDEDGTRIEWPYVRTGCWPAPPGAGLFF